VSCWQPRLVNWVFVSHSVATNIPLPVCVVNYNNADPGIISRRDSTCFPGPIGGYCCPCEYDPSASDLKDVRQLAKWRYEYDRMTRSCENRSPTFRAAGVIVIIDVGSRMHVCGICQCIALPVYIRLCDVIRALECDNIIIDSNVWRPGWGGGDTAA